MLVRHSRGNVERSNRSVHLEFGNMFVLEKNCGGHCHRDGNSSHKSGWDYSARGVHPKQRNHLKGALHYFSTREGTFRNNV